MDRRAVAPLAAAQSVLDFWFGHGPLDAASLEQRMRFWFGADEEAIQHVRDEDVRERFGALTARAALGELDHWASSPRRLLALILMLDQFPRQIHRGTAQAFWQDPRALDLSLGGMQHGADAALDLPERLFFYMPLQHAESVDMQEESVAAFRRLRDEAPAPLRAIFERAHAAALKHQEIIVRFGRFPHRNVVLGRGSTPDELAWLPTAASFGQ